MVSFWGLGSRPKRSPMSSDVKVIPVIQSKLYVLGYYFLSKSICTQRTNNRAAGGQAKGSEINEC